PTSHTPLLSSCVFRSPPDLHPFPTRRSSDLSDDKLARASELGMDHGINHATQDVVAEVMRLTGDRGVDLVFEHVGGELFQKGLDSLCKDGRLVICGGHAGEVVPFDIIPFFRLQRQVIGSFVYTRTEVETCLELARQGTGTRAVCTSVALGA